MINIQSLTRALGLCLMLALGIAACGQKGPLIVSPPPQDFSRIQEDFPNEVSPDDGTSLKSESEAQVQEDESSESPE